MYNPPLKAKAPTTLHGSGANITKAGNQGTVASNVSMTTQFGKLDYAFMLPDGRLLHLKPKAPGVPSPLGRVLAALVDAGETGITNFQPFALGTLEMRDYRYRLVKHYGLSIEGSWENHPGGRHRRWWLRSLLTVLHLPE